MAGEFGTPQKRRAIRHSLLRPAAVSVERDGVVINRFQRDARFPRRPGIDLSNGHFATLAREKNRGGAADPVTAAGDEGYLPCEPWHRSLLQK
jgi:hypothetical protein